MSLRLALACLDLTPEASTRDIRRRYSELLKLNRPEDNPEGFQQLRAAYEICLEFARQRDAQGEASGTPEPATPMPTPASVHGNVAVVDPSPELAADTNGPARIAADPSSDLANGSRIAADTPPAAAGPPRTATDTPATEPLPAADAPGTSAPALFGPVESELPVLREPAAVVDELLQLDAHDALAVPGWFRRTAELVNFDGRDAVEAELLQRLVAGQRPSLATLDLANAEFGWRDLALPRRLAARGISSAQWQAVETALQQAFAEGQFKAHLRQGGALQGENVRIPREKSTLRNLYEQRGRQPALWRAFRADQVIYVNELLQAYARHYGGRTLAALFGVDLLDFWRRSHPGAEPNWLQFRLLALRLGTYFAAIWASVLFFSIDWKTRPPTTALRDGLWPFTLGLLAILAVLLAYGGTKLGYAHFRQQWWPRWLHWRHVLLEQHVHPWLQPKRALPLLAAFAGLIALTQWLAGAGVAVLLCGAVAQALYGVRGLLTAFVASLLVGWIAANWLQGDDWLPLIGSSAVGAAWLGSWIEHRR